MTVLDIIVKYILPILSFFGIGSLIACYFKDRVEYWKTAKNEFEDNKLRNIIKDELSSVKVDIADIKEEEVKLKKSTTTLVRAHIDNLYEKAQNGDKQSINDLLNMTNDPIFIDDDQEATKDKVRTIHIYNGILKKQTTSVQPATNKKVNHDHTKIKR